MLHLKNYFPRIAPWINGWLVVWLLVNGLDGAMAGIPSSVPMIWGFDPDQLLSFIIAGLAGIPFLFLFIMAIKTAGRGYTPAYFLVVAFVIIMICLVLLGTNIYWGDPMTLDHILVYLLQAGLFCSLIFLALGAHYHRKYSV